MVLILFHVQCITNDRIGRTVALKAPLDIFPTIENKFDAFAYLRGQ